MSDDTTPILVGGGQRTQRDAEPAEALDPLGLMADAARAAAEDARADAPFFARVDTVGVVNILSWDYGNAPRLLAERLGAQPRRELYSTIGGNSPQSLVNRIAAEIAADRVGVALLAGAEAVATLTRARKAGVRLRWARADGAAPTILGEHREGTSAHEVEHNFQLPVQLYPLFENAIRAARGWDPATHRARLGTLCAAFTRVAAAHPHAWFPQARAADEITGASPDNRPIAFPYTKRMSAIMDVDQGAAVLLTSVGTAQRLGIPRERWVYLRGCGEAHDQWLVSERVAYDRSPAIRAAGRAALAMAGVDIAAVDHLDLYSCFPSAVQIGRDALGIAADDPRPLTVTGGLPYFGGPGNNYSLHAIATMLERVRAAPGCVGLVTALGWFITKHAVGIYSTTPPPGPWTAPDAAAPQAVVDAEPGPPLATDPSGRGTIETYTVLYFRDGTPVQALVVGRSEDGRRFLAHTPDDRALFEAMTAREAIGWSGRVSVHDGVGRFEPT